jgi:hypothetical protein
MLPAITTRKSGYDVERRKQRNLYLSGWRTGSAAWLFMTGVECLLGARAEYDGLATVHFNRRHLLTTGKAAKTRRM